ncbi:MAG: carbohydrate ABC transporter permease [Clostridia bacterium]|nr:carbohydrate ABC transporter permease [Clostridia bacterium]MBR4442405.1 carbohydrate ABC transporter permease [Clostridia bacterium]
MKKSSSRIAFEWFNAVFLVALCVVMLYPFLNVVASSVSNNSAVSRGRVTFYPIGFNLEAYKAVVRYQHIWTGYKNTILYTVVGTAINLIMTIAGAYPLSRKQFYGRGVFTFIVAFTMFFGGGLIPTYLVINAYGLLDTFWVMVIPGAISTYNMIIMRTFFQGIPVELEEAATIDGCNDIQTLWKVILPLSTASLMTIGMFYAVGHWNAWFNAVIYLRDSGRFPVQLWLRTIVLQNQVRDIVEGSGAVDTEAENLVADTIKFAVIVVAVLPILCVYPFVQKYFVKGVMIGSVKG